MPKRSSNLPVTDKVQKKTERSHEENQERAYIAASRRADRSIEARVQSARMASSIHKKRTGRGFKVSEEIVMKEEMYEEEEDEFPRHYRALTAHLQTGSTDMNNRLNAYVSNHVALANLAHQQQVDRMFAEQFPNAAQVSRRLSNSVYYHPTNQANNQFPSMDYPPTTQDFQKGRSQSMVSTSSNPLSSIHPSISHGSQSPVARHASMDESLSPPVLTPQSGSSSETPFSNTTPVFHAAHNFPATGAAADALVSMEPPADPVFTSELPAETKMLASFDPNDPLTGMYYGDGGEMMGSEGFYDYSNQGVASYMEDAAPVKAEPQEYFNMPSRMGNLGATGGRTDTPGDAWESWVQYD
ncbi:hypothetical protein GQ53DRAFT_767657 [Thozetella sp. PMI_491]|nr:hypothetical protein GQ53DRAFT_767657 [Thozetella sp. PMI_491]